MSKEGEWTAQSVGETTQSRMLYVNGSERTFHCDCGANVFTQDGPNHYICNGCHAGYTSEAKEAKP